MSTLDGPGVRTVVFLQGCNMFCRYCHNIDTNKRGLGTVYEANKLCAEILRNREYWGKEGGVTFTGGEPLCQSEFLLEILKILKQESVNIVIDTNLNAEFETDIEPLIHYVDLWMISLKHIDANVHRELTGVGNELILNNFRLLDSELNVLNRNKTTCKKQFRIRYVVIPNITNTKQVVLATKKFIAGLSNVESVELLPYSRIGRHKWIEIYGKYDFEEVREPAKEEMDEIRELIYYDID